MPLLLLLLALGAIAGCAASHGEGAASFASDAPTEAASTSAAPAPPPAGGRVEPGTYHLEPSVWSVAGYSVTIPEGWEHHFGGFGKHADEPGELWFYFVIVDAIYSDPCHGEGELIEVGPGVDDLVDALLSQPVVLAGEPVDTTLGGWPAKRIDFTAPVDLDAEACRMGDELQIWYSRPADKYFVLLGDGTASVYVIDLDGRRQVLVTQHRAGATREDLTQLRAIVDSIEIDR